MPKPAPPRRSGRRTKTNGRRTAPPAAEGGKRTPLPESSGYRAPGQGPKPPAASPARRAQGRRRGEGEPCRHPLRDVIQSDHVTAGTRSVIRRQSCVRSLGPVVPGVQARQQRIQQHQETNAQGKTARGGYGRSGRPLRFPGRGKQKGPHRRGGQHPAAKPGNTRWAAAPAAFRQGNAIPAPGVLIRNGKPVPTAAHKSDCAKPLLVPVYDPPPLDIRRRVPNPAGRTAFPNPSAGPSAALPPTAPVPRAAAGPQTGRVSGRSRLLLCTQSSALPSASQAAQASASGAS